MNKVRIIFFLFFILLTGFGHAQSFRTSQQKAPRVRSAYADKWQQLQAELKKNNIDPAKFEMLILAFKTEKKVEIWMRSGNEKQFKKFKSYDICYHSGDLGPKRKQGDGQVPEGFYTIAVFNPYSNYHLSLGINYPNKSDRIIGKGNLGGDIMIHGNCVSIGCLPITDTYIKELYILAVEARNNGQATIPVNIFPIRMDDKGMAYLNETYAGNLKLLDFWKNIKTGYDLFEQKKLPPKVNVNASGAYTFN
jgi:murein L,D-transpeptidase YafK